VALSNWDTFALDEKNEPTNGIFKSPLGILVSIYKNWIDIYEGYEGHEMVSRVQRGELLHGDTRIVATRGPKDGVYSVVSNFDYQTKKLSFMIACGVYGYTESGEFVGIQLDDLTFLREWLDEDENDFEPEIRAIDLTKGLRFNQGDAYFAKHIPGLDLAATQPGKPTPTVLSRFFRQGGKR
jgi:hypothetical protein